MRAFQVTDAVQNAVQSAVDSYLHKEEQKSIPEVFCACVTVCYPQNSSITGSFLMHIDSPAHLKWNGTAISVLSSPSNITYSEWEVSLCAPNASFDGYAESVRAMIQNQTQAAISSYVQQQAAAISYPEVLEPFDGLPIDLRSEPAIDGRPPSILTACT